MIVYRNSLQPQAQTSVPALTETALERILYKR